MRYGTELTKKHGACISDQGNQIRSVTFHDCCNEICAKPLREKDEKETSPWKRTICYYMIISKRCGVVWYHSQVLLTIADTRYNRRALNSRKESLMLTPETFLYGRGNTEVLVMSPGKCWGNTRGTPAAYSITFVRSAISGFLLSFKPVIQVAADSVFRLSESP